MDTLKNSMAEMMETGFKPRQLKSFSFGSLENCKKLLMEALRLTDETNEIQWIPEYDQICSWMTNTQGRGLILTGDCGRGKSNLITKALPLLFHYKHSKVIRPLHIDNLEVLFSEVVHRWSFAIDEVGGEPITNKFGEKYFPFVRLMDVAEIHLKLCFISTNLNSQEISEKYGDRTLDRILRLCHPVKFTGESLRPKPLKPIKQKTDETD